MRLTALPKKWADKIMLNFNLNHRVKVSAIRIALTVLALILFVTAAK